MIFGDSLILRKIFKRGLLKNGKESMVNPASVNLCLGNTFLIPETEPFGVALGDKLEYRSF